MVKRTLFTIVLMGLLIASCGGNPSEPPLIYLISNDGLVDGFQSSYCWDSGIGGGICKDTVAPGEYIIAVHGNWKQGVVSYWFSVSLE